MFDLRSLEGTRLLADHRIERYIVAAASMPCFTGRQVAKERDRRMAAARQVASKSVQATSGDVGVIGVHGPLQQRLTSELMKAGGTACDEIAVQLDILLSTPGIGAIVLHVDSPGGSSYGIEELSDKIYNARARKPVYACVDSMACSAAYWLATAASAIWCTPGGDVGSVGVYSIHVDESKALEKAGLSVTLIFAGDYKVEGFGIGPLSDEALEHRQQSVDETYGKFVAGIARNRGISTATVEANFGKGRAVSADAGLAVGMVDRCGTFEQMIRQLVGAYDEIGGTAGRRSGANAMAQLRHEQRLREAAALRLRHRRPA